MTMLKEKINQPMAESDDRAFCWLIENPISEEGFRLGFTPGVEAIIQKRGELRLLVHFSRYQGWLEEAIPHDFEFMSKYYSCKGRTALVNAPEKMKLRIEAMKSLIGSEVRYYDEDGLDTALRWVKA